MAKKAAETTTTDEDLMSRPAKQRFVKMTKSKKENPRTWVVIYRLVDGPPIDPDRAAKRKAKRDANRAKKK